MSTTEDTNNTPDPSAADIWIGRFESEALQQRYFAKEDDEVAANDTKASLFSTRFGLAPKGYDLQIITFSPKLSLLSAPSARLSLHGINIRDVRERARSTDYDAVNTMAVLFTFPTTPAPKQVRDAGHEGNPPKGYWLEYLGRFEVDPSLGMRISPSADTCFATADTQNAPTRTPGARSPRRRPRPPIVHLLPAGARRPRQGRLCRQLRTLDALEDPGTLSGARGASIG